MWLLYCKYNGFVAFAFRHQSMNIVQAGRPPVRDSEGPRLNTGHSFRLSRMGLERGDLRIAGHTNKVLSVSMSNSSATQLPLLTIPYCGLSNYQCEPN